MSGRPSDRVPSANPWRGWAHRLAEDLGFTHAKPGSDDALRELVGAAVGLLLRSVVAERLAPGRETVRRVLIAHCRELPNGWPKIDPAAAATDLAVNESNASDHLDDVCERLARQARADSD